MVKTDVIVLGAGIIGVSAALHLQSRGRAVTLVDRRGVAEETSHGNAGLIERSSVIPYAFPRGLPDLIRYGLNRSAPARYDPAFLPRIAGWLFQYWRNSSPDRLAEAAAAMLPLVERCVSEHDRLIEEADAGHLVRRTGWIEAYRTARALDAAAAKVERLATYGLSHDLLDGRELREREPFLSDALAGAVHWRDPVSVSDPAAVARAYAGLFQRRGGRIARGDAASLRQDGRDWTVETADGPLHARAAVVALGPWSDDVTRRFGYRIPLAVKRGYHMHYASRGNAVLQRPVLDAERGYVLAPMARGIRLTTGVEFAHREAPPTPVQIARTEPLAREIFPLGDKADGEPWLGRRPALPDMRPVIGEAPRHPGLWLAFGHAHHGFTLGPITGRLLAEMMTGAETVIDPAPYSPARFR